MQSVLCTCMNSSAVSSQYQYKMSSVHLEMLGKSETKWKFAAFWSLRVQTKEVSHIGLSSASSALCRLRLKRIKDWTHVLRIAIKAATAFEVMMKSKPYLETDIYFHFSSINWLTGFTLRFEFFTHTHTHTHTHTQFAILALLPTLCSNIFAVSSLIYTVWVNVKLNIR